MNGMQTAFFRALARIQEECVQTALCSYQAGDSVPDLLYDVTYETIISILTMIDGYDAENRLALIDRNTGADLKECPFVELHDAACVYLKIKDHV
ncbi:hypothetical protein [uncultured Dysosmobacter sp.]|uniref:hypothetical protein n=1 Tax=uncultured Dysosmobacter sp. TaxID=2591384 RepID=UPI002605A8DD|nr:hypothetical protein [uncultured Dysosmobacter sp.]